MQTLKKFKQAYKGSSFPTEVETHTGDVWVLKLRSCGNGPQSLISEFIVNRMAHLAGWEVPNVEPILIPNDFPWEFGTDEFDDLVQKSFGLNLGIQFIPEALPLPESDLNKLPIRFLQRLMALDLFFANYDRMGKSQNILKTKSSSFWMIDHASCLFLDPRVNAKALTLPDNHFLKNEKALILNSKVLLEIANRDLAQQALRDLPEPWLQETQFTHSQISNLLDLRIQKFQDAIS